MTVTLTNAPPPSKDEKVASPRSGRQSKASPPATLPGLLLLDQSCSPSLRALCVATLLSVLAVLAMTAERDETRRPERTARAARVRVAASPLTTLTQSADDDTALDFGLFFGPGGAHLVASAGE